MDEIAETKEHIDILVVPGGEQRLYFLTASHFFFISRRLGYTHYRKRYSFCGLAQKVSFEGEIELFCLSSATVINSHSMTLLSPFVVVLSSESSFYLFISLSLSLS